jgi:hypothetical protein
MNACASMTGVAALPVRGARRSGAISAALFCVVSAGPSRLTPARALHTAVSAAGAAGKALRAKAPVARAVRSSAVVAASR